MVQVLIERELLEDLHDLSLDAANHHRQAMGSYRQDRQARMDSIVSKVDAILAHPTQQGEAVEVVGWLGGNGLHADKEAATGAPFSLMTVAQHQCILAASVPAGCKVVPVEFLERVATHLEWDGSEPMTTIQYAYKCDGLAAELRALLASAEGG